MKVGIDASNIRAGGGVTHLRELLAATNPVVHGITSVVVWGPRATLEQLPDESWIEKKHLEVFERNYVARAFWQFAKLGAHVRAEACDILLVPGGSFATKFRPVVTISQNLLPFDLTEARRYGISRFTAKLFLLRVTQSRSFRRATGLIFLSQEAQKIVLRVIGPTAASVKIVPHGLNPVFSCAPRPVRSLAACSDDNPFRVLYVSPVEPYKHHVEVVTAVAALRAKGLPIVIDMVGGGYPPAIHQLNAAIKALDPTYRFIRYRGHVRYDTLPDLYGQAELLVFASTCENLPITLLEGMTAGLPIACSQSGVMVEVLKEGGVYFDATAPDSIAAALERLIGSADLRKKVAHIAYERAKGYSWRKCATETYSFMANLAAHPGG